MRGCQNPSILTEARSMSEGRFQTLKKVQKSNLVA
jgi:hypothetical protein